MTVIILEQADKEFSRSAAFYESREIGLGLRFRDEITTTVGSIQRRPNLPALRAGGYRRVNLRVFPHYVAYIVRKDTLWIVAIAHSHQRPEFWIGRIRTL